MLRCEHSFTHSAPRDNKYPLVTLCSASRSASAINVIGDGVRTNRERSYRFRSKSARHVNTTANNTLPCPQRARLARIIVTVARDRLRHRRDGGATEPESKFSEGSDCARKIEAAPIDVRVLGHRGTHPSHGRTLQANGRRMVHVPYKGHGAKSSRPSASTSRAVRRRRCERRSRAKSASGRKSSGTPTSNRNSVSVPSLRT